MKSLIFHKFIFYIFSLIVYTNSCLTYGQTYTDRLDDLQSQIEDLRFKKNIELMQRDNDRSDAELRRIRDRNRNNSYDLMPPPIDSCSATWIDSRFVKLAPQYNGEWVKVQIDGTNIGLYFPISMSKSPEGKSTISKIISSNNSSIRLLCPKMPKE